MFNVYHHLGMWRFLGCLRLAGNSQGPREEPRLQWMRRNYLKLERHVNHDCLTELRHFVHRCIIEQISRMQPLDERDRLRARCTTPQLAGVEKMCGQALAMAGNTLPRRATRRAQSFQEKRRHRWISSACIFGRAKPIRLSAFLPFRSHTLGLPGARAELVSPSFSINTAGTAARPLCDL